MSIVSGEILSSYCEGLRNFWCTPTVGWLDWSCFRGWFAVKRWSVKLFVASCHRPRGKAASLSRKPSRGVVPTSYTWPASCRFAGINRKIGIVFLSFGPQKPQMSQSHGTEGADCLERWKTKHPPPDSPVFFRDVQSPEELRHAKV